MKSKIFIPKYIAMAVLQIILLSVSWSKVKAQVHAPLNAKLQPLATAQSTHDWIDFKEGTLVNPATIFTDLKDGFELKAGDQMKVKRTENDDLGFTHYRYQQYYKNLRVIYGEYALHQQGNGFVKSANGRVINGLNLGNIASINEKQALDAALLFMHAGKYLWQNTAMEKELKRQQKNENATYLPKGELVYAPNNNEEDLTVSNYKLAWQFKIYPDGSTIPARTVYVDALTGKVIHYTDISMTCSGGSGTSAFNGNVSVNTQPTALNLSYVSHNDCQPTGIYVYNCNGGAAANNLYADADNVWTGQQSAVQAQYGAERTYNYYINVHGRTSWDNSAGDMVAYNNSNQPGLGVNNACWGCTGNSTIFGAGNTSAATDDWNTDDIMGHEFTHGVTQASAGLAYTNESGALNESYSDIFGEMVESWTEGNCDFLVGADRGAIRSFIRPKDYGDPDTYLGTNWYTGSADHGGVHTNSGVQNHWFYLLCKGGSGINDLGKTYNVTGIDRFEARQIAYRALTVYLNSSSKYIDARAASLHAAWDLFGQCSREIIAVGDAWHAVGVESQSPEYVKNACGTYSSGQFVQAISQLTAALGCTVTVNSTTGIVHFTARDRVILYPGFRAVSGSRFIAYLEPCSSTMWKPSGDDQSGNIMSDAERGIKTPVQVAPTDAIMNISLAKEGISITPNPFHSIFDLYINSTQNIRGVVYIFDALGELVKEIPEINLIKGFNKISLNGADLRTGVYMVEIHTGNQKTVKKMVKL